MGQIFGVSVDSQEANAAFAAKFSFSFPLLCDTTKEMTKAFDCCLSAKDGSDPCAMADRVAVVVGADGTILKYIAPFDAREGPRALLSDLQKDEL